MNHMRLLGSIYLALGIIAAIIGIVFFAFFMNELKAGPEAGWLLLWAVPAIVAACPLLAAGVGLLRDKGWGLVIALVLSPIMMATGLGIPLAAYTVFVAFQRWRGAPRVAAITEAANALPAQHTRFGSVAAHMRVLGLLLLSLALLMLYPGWNNTQNAIRDFEVQGMGDPEFVMVVATWIAGFFLLATAIGLLRKKPWGVVLAAIAALPLATMYPYGTMIALYALIVGGLAWRQVRTEPDAT